MGNKSSKGINASNLSCLDPFEGFRVPFVDLQEATNNFDESLVIGSGGFGKVYRGILCDGTDVALKRRNPESRQGIEEFQKEIKTLSQLRHPYVVSFIGYCDEDNDLILIFKFMENGTLKRHLYGSDLPTMSWELRLEICIGAAKGLHYLHTNSVIHRDVKSANILLDENFVPKITDFGLSEKSSELDETHFTTDVKGTLGYVDPEYYRSLRLTEKSDVYSFGVVLLEVYCARPAIDSSRRGMENLADWALRCHKNRQLDRIIDPNLLGKVRPGSLRKFGETAVKCLAVSGEDRPSMSEVLWNLEYALHLLEPVIQDNPEENSTIPIGELSPQINDFRHV